MQVRNSVTLIGNVGQLPTVKTLTSGTRVIEFSLATNDSYRNKAGERITRTEWHTIKAFGKVVDTLERYVTKGTQLALTGSIRYSRWTDKHEQTRVSTEIILDEFTFLGSRDGSSYSTREDDTEQSEMMAAEPAPKKTAKRRSKKAAAMTPAEDLPF
ncbi:single-strand DNA-binding protein [Neolewinella xylanilytica]|uniref:Single-stranded DNA-binding protein n=1 Tax=Neolewinella xylanilytica TaxID=1514080 RepID=A0A2S6I7M6_9BACT|nr:single-stranded DNA-binding protein [Neolewinella xylanilytica]PPK87496.1 single-strand DNA-binding protein [Neolewinella xylanilytica]